MRKKYSILYICNYEKNLWIVLIFILWRNRFHKLHPKFLSLPFFILSILNAMNNNNLFVLLKNYCIQWKCNEKNNVLFKSMYKYKQQLINVLFKYLFISIYIFILSIMICICPYYQQELLDNYFYYIFILCKNLCIVIVLKTVTMQKCL